MSHLVAMQRDTVLKRGKIALMRCSAKVASDNVSMEKRTRILLLAPENDVHLRKSYYKCKSSARTRRTAPNLVAQTKRPFVA